MACGGRRKSKNEKRAVGAFLKKVRSPEDTNAEQGERRPDITSRVGYPGNGNPLRLPVLRENELEHYDIVVGMDHVSGMVYQPTQNGSNSLDELGYYLCKNGTPDGAGCTTGESFGVIPTFTASRSDKYGSQTNTAYCLSHDTPQFFAGGQYESTTMEEGFSQRYYDEDPMEVPPKSVVCPVMWLLANGYQDRSGGDGYKTDSQEFFKKLGVTDTMMASFGGNLDKHAQYLTQAAIWRIIDEWKHGSTGRCGGVHFCKGDPLNPPNCSYIDCGTAWYDSGGNPMFPLATDGLVGLLNACLNELVYAARGNSNCGRPAEWNPDDFEQPPEYQKGSILKRYKDAVMPVWYDEPRQSRLTSKGRQMGTSCTFSYADFVACGQDAPGMQWAIAPSSVRMICGKTVIGPIQLEAKAGDEPDMDVEACCACADGFGTHYVDVCGNALPNPQPGDEVYLSNRVTGRVQCMTVCGEQDLDVSVEENRVYIIDTGTFTRGGETVVSKNQNLGTWFFDKHEAKNEEDETCMMICVRLLSEEVTMPLPPPMPLFYQQMRLPPACLPPDVIIGKPVVTQPPKPPKRTLPTPPQDILVAPPPLPPPSMVFMQQPAVVPPLPMPPSPGPYIARQPILYTPAQPPAPMPAPRTPEPVFYQMPSQPPVQPPPSPIPAVLQGVLPEPPRPSFEIPPPNSKVPYDVIQTQFFNRMSGVSPVPPPPPPPPPPVPPEVRALRQKPQLPVFDLTLPITRTGEPVPYGDVQTNLIAQMSAISPPPSAKDIPAMPPPAPRPQPRQLEIPHYSQIQNDLLKDIAPPVIPRRMDYPWAQGAPSHISQPASPFGATPPAGASAPYAARTQPPSPFGG